MSDLQCPVTVLVARPGEPTARGALTADGREQARELARSLASARVTTIYTGGAPYAVESAELAAAVLGVGAQVSDGLRERSAEESSTQARLRACDELDSIADLHRGETVLVLAHPSVIVSALVGLGAGSVDPPRGCAVLELAGDADGWVLRHRPEG